MEHPKPIEDNDQNSIDTILMRCVLDIFRRWSMSPDSASGDRARSATSSNQLKLRLPPTPADNVFERTYVGTH